MLRPISLTSAKVPNDLEIYPTFNVELNTWYTNDNGSITLLSQGYGWMYASKDKLAQALLSCDKLGAALGVSNIPWNKSIQLILELPSDTFPHGRFYLYGSYNAVDFTHILATEDYVQQQIQGAINAVY